MKATEKLTHEVVLFAGMNPLSMPLTKVSSHRTLAAARKKAKAMVAEYPVGKRRFSFQKIGVRSIDELEDEIVHAEMIDTE